MSMLRKATLSLAGLVFLITSVLSQPKLSLDKQQIELGSMFSGAKRKGTIGIKNIGSDTLRIYSVQPSCGCTAVKQPKPFLLPNQSDVAEIEFNSAGMRGKIEKHVSITTNDPLSQYVDVLMVAEVKEVLTPVNGSSLMWFNNIILGQSANQTITLKNLSGETLTILNVAPTSPTVSVSLSKKKLAPNETVDIQVTVKPDKPNYNSEHFVIETDNKNQPNVEIRASFIGVKEGQ
jgi:hypothetical protein